MQQIQIPEQESNHNITAGPGSMVSATVAAIVMIAATALLLPTFRPGEESGICFTIPWDIIPGLLDIAINTVLIALAVVLAFLYNKKHSFVRSTEPILPVTLAILLASNPLVTSNTGIPMLMLIVNLICLDILMRSYASQNATTSMFAVATYLSVGSMIEYAFVPFILVYPVMGMMCKVMRVKEWVAYLMGLVAPYWVVMGFGLRTISDFRLPDLPMQLPWEGGGEHLIFVYISLGTMILTGLLMMVNNSMLIYAGNMRVRTFNNMINLLGFLCTVCMIADFDNMGAYLATLCFAVSVQIANFFAMRRIEQSSVWFWCLLSVFIAFFGFMLIENLVA